MSSNDAARRNPGHSAPANTNLRLARWLSVIVVVAVTSGCHLHTTTPVFGYNQVVAKARTLAGKTYQAPAAVPRRFAKLDYSHWSAIHFKRARALWQGARFHVQFAPAGYLFKHAVSMHIVDHGTVRPLAFDPDMFRVDDDMLPKGLVRGPGFAGFKLTYPLNRPDKQDEVLSFLGASYFRAVPEGGWFGLSARGVAIDTTAQKQEQFPRFSDFWLVKPRAEADHMTLYALLNGKSLTGAYRFRIKPGAPTVVDVRATVFLRHPVEQLGLAPLTSMFFYGTGTHKPANQAVPAIHDSNGLLIKNQDDQWTWRPLRNPHKVRTTRFPTQDLLGFGLLQRDRRSKDYKDSQARYARRPSLWIQPQTHWGPGHVTLVELPTDNSYMDNIVAFWTPAHQPTPGQPLQLRYRMSWRLRPVASSVGRVVSTLVGGNEKTGAAKYVIDYAGGKLASVDADTPPEGWVKTRPDTAVNENRVEPNPYTGGWRQVIQVMPRKNALVYIHAGLRGKHKQPLTETWSFSLPTGAIQAR